MLEFKISFFLVVKNNKSNYQKMFRNLYEINSNLMR